MLDPKLADLRDRLYDKAYDATTPPARSAREWAGKLGLPAGIPIAIGEIGRALRRHRLRRGRGHAGQGHRHVAPATARWSRADKTVADIPGICGIVPGAILPGYYGIEAGPDPPWATFSSGGSRASARATRALHARTDPRGRRAQPGQSGLLALDWNNGNRTILVDPRLTGLLLGQTLHTTRAEIYRALIEATAFGARAIIERLREYGVPVERVVCAAASRRRTRCSCRSTPT